MLASNPAETFLIEAEELLEQIEEVALQLESSPHDSELINSLFRCFHTIKGCSGMFGYDAVAAFTHHVETALDHVREERLEITPCLVGLVLRAKDQIGALLNLRCGSGPDDGTAATLVDQIVALQREAGIGGASATVAESQSEPERTGIQHYAIRFRPAPGVFATGLDPACLLDELRSLGDCQIEADFSRLPSYDQFDPTQCCLEWNISLSTDRGTDAIRDVFIFVEESSELTIEELPPKAQERVVSGNSSPQDSLSSTAIAPVKARSTDAQSAVRVPSERLDRLVSLVGELVINQSRLTQAHLLTGCSEMAAPVEAMDRLIAELRDSVLGIRMLPIGATFGKFQRLVRDLSRDLGKEVELVTEGAETELDKTVIDQLGDPLVHLIRNSLDHGIESPAEREAAGKSKTGTLRLAAVHEGGHVIISISDDGRGIDAMAVRAKAEEKGLIAAGAPLSESEILNLVFLPGFSTAKTVSNVSGRGVGMDVVKRAIEGLRGTIALSSALGGGTTVRLTLPLTLAIIDGLLVELNEDRFIVPMTAVTENVELTRHERDANNGRNVVAVRGELIPYLRLRELFEVRSGEPAVEKIVIVSHDGQRIGLVVDRVIGSHQTVIQSLGLLYRGVELFSGTTIMGDGRVAMILNLAGIVRYAAREPQRRPGLPPL